MTSTSRSSSRRALRPALPPSWISTPAAKQGAPPSVSAIVAEADPSVLSRSDADVPETSGLSSTGRSTLKRSRFDSVSSLRTVVIMNNIAPKDMGSTSPNCPEDPSPERPELTEPSPDVTSQLPPNVISSDQSSIPSSEDSSAANQEQKKSSWLKSVVRVRNRGPAEAKEQLPKSDQGSRVHASSELETTAQVPEASTVSPPTIHRTPNNPDSGHVSSSLKSNTFSLPSQRSWFSYPPSSQAPLPTSPGAPSTASVPSSVDEEVPSLSKVDSRELPVLAAPTLVQTEETGLSTLSSLNPSTSRFTLAMPIFRRPRTTQVRRANDDNGRSESNNLSETRAAPAPPNESEPPSEAPALDHPVAFPSSTEAFPAPLADAPEKEGQSQGPTVPSSSWWHYLSWGESGAGLPSDSQKKPAEPDALPASESAATASDKAASTLTVQVSPAHMNGHTNPQDSFNETIGKVGVEATDMQQPSWYSPWAWYSRQPVSEDTGGASIAPVAAANTPPGEVFAAPSAKPVDLGPAPVSAFQGTASESGPRWTSLLSQSLTTKGFTASSEIKKEAEVTDTNQPTSLIRPEDNTISDDSTTVSTVANAVTKLIKGKEPMSRSGRSTPTKGTPLSSPDKADLIKPPRIASSEPIKGLKRPASPSPSISSTTTVPPTPKPSLPNIVLPSWADTFHSPPRSIIPSPPPSTLQRTLRFVGEVLFAKHEDSSTNSKGGGLPASFGRELPRAWNLVDQSHNRDQLRGCSKAVIIGVHGWFPGPVIRSVIGEPTATSSKLASMMFQALEEFQTAHNVSFDKITQIPLDGEGTIDRRAKRLYDVLVGNRAWLDDVHDADVILVATHSQGSIVSIHILDRLIRDGHIVTSKTHSAASGSAIGSSTYSIRKPQKICALQICGIHLGPLRYFNMTLLFPYIQYIDSAAARELFDFQSTDNVASQAYVKALKNVVDNGAKLVYVASMNDQVVPIYSGLFTSASHPLILRALYIDGDAHQSSDFLSNLLVLLLRILNSGLSDSGLLVYLSEVTAGSLSGVGHSNPIDELSVYTLAVNYLFLTNEGSDMHPELMLEPFSANTEQNDYEIPWALRDLIADERVIHLFSDEIAELRNAFRHWSPKPSILRDIKRKLQPIQRLPKLSSKL